MHFSLQQLTVQLRPWAGHDELQNEWSTHSVWLRTLEIARPFCTGAETAQSRACLVSPYGKVPAKAECCQHPGWAFCIIGCSLLDLVQSTRLT